ADEGCLRCVRAAAPGLDVDASVAVADQGRETVLERLGGAAGDRRAIVAVGVGGAAVEGGQQAPARAARNRHRAAYRRAPRVAASGVEGERSAPVVEPGQVGDDARIVAFGAEGRDQHWRASVDEWARARPDPFAGQGMSEDRLDAG